MTAVLKLLHLFTKRERRQLLVVLLIAVVGAVIETVGIGAIAPFIAVVSNPQLTSDNAILRWAYETGGFTSHFSFSIALGGAVVVVFGLSSAYSAFSAYAVQRYSWMRMYSLSQRLVEQYLSYPYEFFVNSNSSELTKNILQETQQVVGGFLTPLLTGVTRGLVAIAITGLLILANPAAAALLIGVVSIGFGTVFFITRKRLISLGEKRIQADNARYTAAYEAFGAIKELRVLGLENAFSARYSSASRSYVDSQVWSNLMAMLPRYLIDPIALGAAIGVVLLLFAVRGNLADSLPLLSIYALGGARMIPAANATFQGISRARNSAPSVDLLFEEMHNVAAEQRSTSQSKSARSCSTVPTRYPFRESIELNGVAFSYQGGNEAVIDGLNVKIRRNTAVGFVGPTGCGKSTTLDVILGLLPPNSGELLVDGQPLMLESNQSWQANFGYVPQHIFLIDDTIAKNVALGEAAESIDQARLKIVCMLAQLHDFVEQDLVNGYETLVGERGIRLSGGQRQRIGIARALYRDPPILVLDEATSALDSETEREFIEAVSNLRKTVIVVAHRISTVKACDEIHLMRNGRILDRGTYDELFGRNRLFRELAGS